MFPPLGPTRFLYLLLNDHLYQRAAQTHSGALFFSVEMGLENNIARLLTLAPRNLCLENWHGSLQQWRGAAHRAVSNQQLGITRQILEHGGAAVLKNYGDRVVFTLSISSQNIDMLQLLLQHGCSVDVPTCFDEKPLRIAVHGCCQDIIPFLLDQGANTDLTDSDPDSRSLVRMAHDPSQSLLHMAVRRVLDTHESVVGLLVQRGADVNIQDGMGNTALHFIASSPYTPQSSQMTDLLLENGANVQVQNHAGQTAFNVAIAQNNRVIPKVLLNAWLRYRKIDQRPPQRD